MPNVPLSGTPGVFDPRNPTLIPNVDRAVANGNTVDLESPATFLKNNPRGDAAASVAFGGTVTIGDELTLVVSSPALAGPASLLSPAEISHTYTTVSGDNLDTIAEALADLFNDDSNAQAYGLRADPTDAGIVFRWNGPVGNFASLVALFDPDTIQVGGTRTAGDTLNVMFTGPSFPGGHVVSYATVSGDSTPTLMATHLAAALNADAVLSALSISASATGPNIALTIPAAAEPATVSVYANPGTSTATVGGTPGAGDTVQLAITNAALPGGVHDINYTVLLGDTTATIAAALGALINADPVLIAANITATVATTAVTILFPANIGGVTFARTVTGGTTLTLAGASATETLAYINTATETMTVSSGTTPIAAATATATIGGTIQATDTVALTLTNAGLTGLPITVTYTVAGGNTTTTIAAALVALINANAVLQAAGIYAENAAAVITVYSEGTIGNATVLSAAVGGSSPTETVTLAPTNGHLSGGAGTIGNAFTGGSGPVIPYNNFNFSKHSSTFSMWGGKPVTIGYDVLQDMVNQGMPVV